VLIVVTTRACSAFFLRSRSIADNAAGLILFICHSSNGQDAFARVNGRRPYSVAQPRELIQSSMGAAAIA